MKLVREKNRLTIALIINLLIVFFESIALFQTFITKEGGFNYSLFQYYTHYSNFFAFLACLYVSLEISKEVTGAIKRTRYTSRLFRFITVCMMTLTFFTVILILIPMAGWSRWRNYLIENNFIFEHVLCPILCFVSFAFFGDYRDFGKKEALLSVIPTALYAIILTVLNVLNIVDGPFRFLRVHEQSVLVSVMWFILLVGGSYLIAIALLWIQKKIHVSEIRER